MFKLADYVRQNFAGLLAFGDLHADLASLDAAIEFADSQNLFLLSLGDLVDRGRHPFECVQKMHARMMEKKAGLTIGNHDDKFRRLGLGNKVSLSADQTLTMEDVGDSKDDFLRMYSELQSTEGFSSLYFEFDNLIIAHAASHPDMWIERGKFSNEARTLALYGEVTGERYDDGMPIRYYNWVNEIPQGKTVIVGHDRKPVHNVAITEPLVLENSAGGKAIFIDTGCGKGGFLTAAVIKDTGAGFVIDSFKDFR